MRPPGLILAGGTARRMGGGDKVLLPLGRGTLLSSVAGRLGPQVSALALSANGDPDRFADYALPVLPDPIDDAGPLAGVLAGMDWAAANGAAMLVTAAGDTPFLPRDLVARLEAAAPSVRPALAGSADGRHPTFGIWPTSLREDLRARLADGHRRVTDWADLHGAVRVDFSDKVAFFNVNAPGDLRRAEALLAGAEAR